MAKPILPILLTTVVLAGCSSGGSHDGNMAGERIAAEAEPSPATAAIDDSTSPEDDDAAVANQTVTSENYAAVMSARAREYGRKEYKPVMLSRLESGDNVYLEVTSSLEGAAPRLVLCTAPQCADWRDAGRLPAALKGAEVGAKFGTADQVDGSGAVVTRGNEAIVALRLPTAPRKGVSSGTGGELPLTPGVYVLDGTGCENPANAAWRAWDGEGLSGSATRDCRATILSRDGDRYTIRNSCENTYNGSRTPETLTIRVPDQVHFSINGRRFRSCSMAQVPEALRRLVRPSS